MVGYSRRTKDRRDLKLKEDFTELYPISQKLMRLIGGSIRDYNMIRAKDRIVVCFSGGKDSALLALALAVLRRRSPVKFDLAACMVDQSGGSMNADKSSEYLKTIGIPLAIIKHNTYEIIKTRDERSPCSLCANMRRGILAAFARSKGFNVIALGHHKDDATETVLLNLLYEGRFKCWHPHLYMSRTGVRVIRPLAYVGEKSVALERARLGLPVVNSCCPYGDKSKRESARALLAQMEEEFPEIKSNLIHALKNSSDCDTWKEKILNGEKSVK